jgi:hypothetical protein
VTHRLSAARVEGGGSDPTRKTAFAGGLLYLITFIASIPAALLLQPMVSDPTWIVSSASAGDIRLAAFLDLVNALAAIGTAVALFSVVKREHEGLALGFVTTRMFEAAVIAIGVVSILAVITLQDPAATGAEATSLIAVGSGLVAVRDWTFILGPGMAALNAVLLGTLLYRSRLVPRWMPALGLIGAATFGSWVAGTVMGVSETGTAWHSVGVAPIFIWELSIGLWMTFVGFRRRAPLVAAAAEHQGQRMAVTGGVA